VAYTDGIVLEALDGLRKKGMARSVMGSGQRVVKYRHVLDDALELSAPELALVSLLLLRGPQTVGELRARSERAHSFASLDEVEKALDALAAREEPVVARLRQAGQKEDRYTHLLGPRDEPSGGLTAAAAAATVNAELEGRVATLETAVASLRAELKELRESLGG
jgi:uncharacterized protein YceH (UPF0502 family)